MMKPFGLQPEPNVCRLSFPADGGWDLPVNRLSLLNRRSGKQSFSCEDLLKLHVIFSCCPVFMFEVLKDFMKHKNFTAATEGWNETRLNSHSAEYESHRFSQLVKFHCLPNKHSKQPLLVWKLQFGSFIFKEFFFLHIYWNSPCLLWDR